MAITHAGNAHAGCATYAQNGSVTDGYYLQNNCTAIISNYAPCKVVTNNTGAEIFVPSYYPTAISAVGQNEWNSFLAHPPAGVSVASCSCTLPWGGSLTPGQSVTAYKNSSEPCHGSCKNQTRTCACTDNSGLCVLSGSYTKKTCSVTACLPCSLPWGGSINDGQSAGAYATASVACGSSCSGQTRSCNNGSLSGSYTKQSCSVQPCPCSLPWGGSLASGSHVAAYRYASVACGSSCNGQNRICSNGSLSGSYTNKGCSVGACGCSSTSHTWSTHCSGTVAAKSSGQSETVTNTASSYTGSIKASCNNGAWSYSNASCTYSGGTGTGGGGCFLGDTYVLMADGTSKHIENLKAGDLVASPHGANRVLGMDIHHKKQKIYAFNGGKPFITGEHIVFTITGPKVIDPALAKKEAAYYDGLYHTHANAQVLKNLKPGQLKVGDIIKMANGKLLPVHSITWVEQKVHTLFNPALGGNHLYYANGLLVHNLKCAPGHCAGLDP